MKWKQFRWGVGGNSSALPVAWLFVFPPPIVKTWPVSLQEVRWMAGFFFDPLTLEASPRNLERKWASAQLPLQVFYSRERYHLTAPFAVCQKISSSFWTAAAASSVCSLCFFYKKYIFFNLIYIAKEYQSWWVSEFLDLHDLHCDLLWTLIQAKYRQKVQLVWN